MKYYVDKENTMLDEIQNTFDLDRQEKEAQRVLQELPDEEEKIDLKLL